MTHEVQTRLFRRKVDFGFSGPWMAYWTVFLRLVVGWWFLHAGLTKYAWYPGGEAFSSKGWLAGQFPMGPEGPMVAVARPDWLRAFFDIAVSSATLLAISDFMIPFGEVLIGLGLIVGGFVRLASFFGALLLFFFYFGNPGDLAHGFVNGNLLGIFLFIGMIVWGAGRVYGLDAILERTTIVKNHPRMRYLLG